MMITREQFLKIMPYAKKRVDIFLQPLNDAMAEFQINTSARQCAFIAQVAHESASFLYMRELADGSAYEGREDLGNDEPGDGVRYAGRGPIQITGKKNVGFCSIGLFGDARLISNPELLEEPVTGCRSAGWFWTIGAGLNLSAKAKAHGLQDGCNLNLIADGGDFAGITLAVNGGFTGYETRLDLWHRAAEVLV